MKRILMLSIVFLFFVVSINATQGIRDNDSYYIKFDWGNPALNPAGVVVIFGTENVLMTAVRTSEGFNVYAENGSEDAETGASIMDNSAYPGWYASYGWDVPDADPSYHAKAPVYLITLDTYQGKWWLFHVQDPNLSETAGTRGVINLYVPMSGKIDQVEFNEDGTIDMKIEEEGGDWKCLWSWGPEIVKLQNRDFVVHIDPANKTGYLVPERIFEEDNEDN